MFVIFSVRRSLPSLLQQVPLEESVFINFQLEMVQKADKTKLSRSIKQMIYWVAVGWPVDFHLWTEHSI